MPDLGTLIFFSLVSSLVVGLGLCFARDIRVWLEHRAWHRDEMLARRKLTTPQYCRPPQSRHYFTDEWAHAESIHFERVLPREQCPDEEWIGG